MLFLLNNINIIPIIIGTEAEINSSLVTPSSSIKLTNEQISIDIPLKTNSKPMMYKINFKFNLFILFTKKDFQPFLIPRGLNKQELYHLT